MTLWEGEKFGEKFPAKNKIMVVPSIVQVYLLIA